MPFIRTNTNLSLTDKNVENLKNQFGNAISILGKSQSWLMLEFDGDCNLFFQGQNNQNYAMVEISVFGDIDKYQAEEMTLKVCNILQNELDIDPSNIYVKYEGTHFWGWNKNNF